MENTRVLAITSGGGHWRQLMQLRSAFEQRHTAYLTTDGAYAQNVSRRMVAQTTLTPRALTLPQFPIWPHPCNARARVPTAACSLEPCSRGNKNLLPQPFRASSEAMSPEDLRFVVGKQTFQPATHFEA